MLSNPERACLAIADIAGYTGYLAGTELDHAQDILADLMGTVVDALRPSFRLAKLEGDAAFAYVIADAVDGSQLQDVVEGTYFAFRRRLRDIRQASRCECNACILIPKLDLKLVVHHGTIVRQRIAGRDELAGADVIVVHRLLKNAVERQTGLRAYALYTQACVEAMGVDPVAQGLLRHEETTDVAGPIMCWLRDLDAAWQAEQERRRIEVRPEDARLVISFETPAPPQLAWEFATSPIRRPQWGAGITAIIEASPAGRRGAGTTNHCMHGKDAVIEEILDWRPHEYCTTRNTLPMPGVPRITMTDALVPLPDGRTRVETRVAAVKGRGRAAFEGVVPMLEQMVRAAAGGLEAALDEELARRAEQRADEPQIALSAGRHLVAVDTSQAAHPRA